MAERTFVTIKNDEPLNQESSKFDRLELAKWKVLAWTGLVLIAGLLFMKLFLS